MSGRLIHAVPEMFCAVRIAALAAVVFSVSSCAKKTTAHVPAPPPVKIGATETGVASWYGIPYDGRASASGEIFNMHALTAAHRTFPFGTWLEVTDLDNGKKVQVRINDRGPFVKGRIIDLSLGAAEEIEMVGPGLARVKLKVIPTPKDLPRDISKNIPAASSPQALPPSSPSSAPPLAENDNQTPAVAERFAVQAGAFSTKDRAESFQNSLAEKFEGVHVVHVVSQVGEGDSIWRVLIGSGLTMDAANQLAEQVRKAGGDAIVVPDR